MSEIIAVEPHFSVCYEDDYLIVVDKAAPLVVHPTGTKEEPSLQSGLQALLAFELATGGQISLINRLDRETSGLTLVAKTAAAARELGIAMQNRQIDKSYSAIALGWPAWQEARCEEPILRMGDVRASPIHVRQCCHKAGKPCRTDFKRLQCVEARGTRPRLSLLRCYPRTGRMHQIRVHAEFLGLPLLGDKIYGHDGSSYLRFMQEGWSPELAQKLQLMRHALHADELAFTHPFTGEQLRLKAPLPAVLQDLLA